MKRPNPIVAVFLPALIVAAGFMGVFALSDRIERQRPALPEAYGDTDLFFNGSRVKGFAFGLDGLIADWYWMRSLQYIGDKILSRPAETINLDDLRDLNPRLLYPFLENATDLDPHFIAAYSYGAIVMPAIDPEKAIAITKKGIDKNPDAWRLYQHLGYIYWKLGRYAEAADAYDRGSRVAGAAPFMRMMGAMMQTEGGSRATAREIFRQMYDGTDDPAVRITAERRLAELDSLDEREAIDATLAEFLRGSGRCANELREVFPRLMQVKLPEGRDFRVDAAGKIVDPTGAPYLLDRDGCKVRLDPERTGLPQAPTTR